jgi:hypothetical protein
MVPPSFGSLSGAGNAVSGDLHAPNFLVVAEDLLICRQRPDATRAIIRTQCGLYLVAFTATPRLPRDRPLCGLHHLRIPVTTNACTLKHGNDLETRVVAVERNGCPLFRLDL